MFYTKHLLSLEDLQAERAILKKKEKQKAKTLEKSSKSDSHPLKDAVGFVSKSITGSSKLAPILELATKTALPYLIKRGAKSGIQKVALNLAKEVTFGYVKWKAISIAASFISKEIKRRRKK